MKATPKGWDSVPLSDVCYRIVDGSHNPPKAALSGLPMLSARNIQNRQIIFDDFRLISESDFAEENKRTDIKTGDVLVTIVGAIGRTAVVRQSTPVFTLQRSVAVLKAKELHPNYLAYLVESPNIQQFLLENAKGTAQKGIYLKALGMMQIPLAPLPEQKRIADKLDATLARVDACRERLARVAPILKRFRQSVLAAAVSGRLTADWRAQQAGGDNIPLTTESPDQPAVIEPASGNQAQTRSPDAAQRNPGNNAASPSDINPDSGATTPASGLLAGLSANLPFGWESSNIGSAAVNQDNFRKPIAEVLRKNRQGAFAYYGASGVIDTIDGFTHDGSFLLIGEDGANLLTRSKPIAFIAAGKIWVNNHAHVLTHDSTDRLSYLCYAVNAIDLAPWVTGSAQPKLTRKAMDSIPVLLPPSDEQTEIVRRVESLFAFADRLEARLAAAQTAAEQLTPALLAKAFRGELVPQDPADEPASELLQRLAASRANAAKPKRSRTPRQPA